MRGRAFLLFLSFISVVGCQRATPVYLLTVDTLRPDHLGAYGYDRDTAPAISRLAQDGFVFTRAFTTAPKTSPAYASMFTGLSPHEHGLTMLGQALPAGNVTLAERLSADGYRSGGFVSSTVMIDRLSALGQGFETWDDRMPAREANRDNFERHAPDTVDAAMRWLDAGRRRADRTFLFLHLIDPHGPYTPPQSVLRRFRRGGGRTLADDDVPAFQRLEGATTLGQYIDAYDGEIAHADAALGRILDRLRDEGTYDEALIIVTADHGESFGTDDVYFRHGVTLSEASTRIPLIIKPPRSRLSSARTIESPVSLADIVPTVLDYLEMKPSTASSGISLRSMIEGRDARERTVVYSSRRTKAEKRIAAHGRYTTVRAVVSGDGALTKSAGGPPHDSSVGLAGKLEAEVRRRSEQPRRYEAEWRYRPSDKEFVKRFIDVHDAEALRRLGYIE